MATHVQFSGSPESTISKQVIEIHFISSMKSFFTFLFDIVETNNEKE